jgi:hypothetical protein
MSIPLMAIRIVDDWLIIAAWIVTWRTASGKNARDRQRQSGER